MKYNLTDLINGAKTCYGEARGESRDGIVAVACVLRNRLRKGFRGAKSLSEVCLNRAQFSCWNPGDPNQLILTKELFDPLDTPFWNCLDSMRYVMLHDEFDTVKGATHYCTKNITPFWAVGKEPCCEIGNHKFYTNIN